MEDQTHEIAEQHLFDILPKILKHPSNCCPISRNFKYKYISGQKTFEIDFETERRMAGKVSLCGIYNTVERARTRIRYITSSIDSFKKFGFNKNDYRILVAGEGKKSEWEDTDMIMTSYYCERYHPNKPLDPDLKLITIFNPKIFKYRFDEMVNRGILYKHDNCIAIKIQNIHQMPEVLLAFEGEIENCLANMEPAWEKFNESEAQ